MTEFSNEFEKPVAQAPGQKDEIVAQVISEGLSLLLDLHLTPRAKEALALLYGEVSEWYNHQTSVDIKKFIPLLAHFLSKFGQTKE